MRQSIAIAFLLIFFTTFIFAADALTEQQLHQILQETKLKVGATMNDRGTYLVVSLPQTQEFVAFTKAGHPAHPGILTIRIFEENGETKLSSTGRWGGNEKEFLKFQNETNRRFIELFNDFQQIAPGDAPKAALPRMASSAEIVVQQIGQEKHELIYISPNAFDENTAIEEIRKAALSVCAGSSPTFGKYKYEINEPVVESSTKQEASLKSRFVQEISCMSVQKNDVSAPFSFIKSEDEAQRVKTDITEKSKRYFELIASGSIDDALVQMNFQMMGVEKYDIKKRKVSFRELAGKPLEISINKITIYDNPSWAQEKGLYVAADYSNKFENIPIHCGYLVWFQSAGNEFRLSREETGYITSAQLKEIPEIKLSEIKNKMRCPP